jgi:L-amino acid N-acyltransferase YncA
MLTFQRETWADLWRDGQEIFKAHYDELALHKEAMPMGLDNDAYTDLERKGYLLVVAGRRDGALIGYYMAIVIAHSPHNKDAGKVASTDFFYVVQAHRYGGAGVKLLKAAAKELKLLGVTVASISIKLRRDEQLNWSTRRMLEMLGWEPTDLVLQLVMNERQG